MVDIIVFLFKAFIFVISLPLLVFFLLGIGVVIDAMIAKIFDSDDSTKDKHYDSRFRNLF